jgi:hypothetical protein
MASCVPCSSQSTLSATYAIVPLGPISSLPAFVAAERGGERERGRAFLEAWEGHQFMATYHKQGLCAFLNLFCFCFMCVLFLVSIALTVRVGWGGDFYILEGNNCLSKCRTNQPTNSMEQSPFWEDDTRSAGKEITLLSWNPMVHYSVYKSLSWASWV